MSDIKFVDKTNANSLSMRSSSNDIARTARYVSPPPAPSRTEKETDWIA